MEMVKSLVVTVSTLTSVVQQPMFGNYSFKMQLQDLLERLYHVFARSEIPTSARTNNITAESHKDVEEWCLLGCYAV
jgi:hypothetical protein